MDVNDKTRFRKAAQRNQELGLRTADANLKALHQAWISFYEILANERYDPLFSDPLEVCHDPSRTNVLCRTARTPHRRRNMNRESEPFQALAVSTVPAIDAVL